MKILHLSTFDTIGGAARAAYRIHQGLRNLEADSWMLVRKKASSDSRVIEPTNTWAKLATHSRAVLNNHPLRRYPGHDSGFSCQWLPDKLFQQVTALNPDIVNLHWIANGYLQIESLARLKKPVVWTLMDMWPFTGGCHYSGNCMAYKHSCGQCPILKSSTEMDLSKKIWRRKFKAWESLNLTIVSPSSWLAQCARESQLFQNLRVETIPFCLDTQIYKPADQVMARNVFNLPQDKALVLFGAISATQDQRKGFHLLQGALQKLSQTHWRDTIELVVFGSSKPQHPPDLGFKTHYLGHLHDDASLAVLYSAADLMVVPSTQEAFGQTASEASACGTPVVAFNNSGLTDIIDHKKTGYLVKAFDIDELAHSIGWILEDYDRLDSLKKMARQKAFNTLALENQAKQYYSLFSELLSI